MYNEPQPFTLSNYYNNQEEGQQVSNYLKYKNRNKSPQKPEPGKIFFPKKYNIYDKKVSVEEA